MLLSLYSLVQTITPSATFHDTTSLFINDLYLSVDDNILIILIKHTVCLQQLLEGVNSFTLNSVVVHHLVFLVETFLVCETCLCLKS